MTVRPNTIVPDLVKCPLCGAMVNERLRLRHLEIDCAGIQRGAATPTRPGTAKREPEQP